MWAYLFYQVFCFTLFHVEWAPRLQSVELLSSGFVRPPHVFWDKLLMGVTLWPVICRDHPLLSSTDCLVTWRDLKVDDWSTLVSSGSCVSRGSRGYSQLCVGENACWTWGDFEGKVVMRSRHSGVLNHKLFLFCELYQIMYIISQCSICLLCSTGELRMSKQFRQPFTLGKYSYSDTVRNVLFQCSTCFSPTYNTSLPDR